MGEQYARVSGRFWTDTKDWGPHNQRVALYLLTNRHRTMEGLYHLPLGYLCADLNITPRQAQQALEFIQTTGLVAYDPDAEVVFIRKALKHAAPKTANHIKGAISRLTAVPSSPLWHEFRMACECHADGLADAMRVAWPSLFASSSSSSNTPPLTPPGGNGDGMAVGGVGEVMPVRPVGGRRRDVEAYEVALRLWVERWFPGVEVGAVTGVAAFLRLSGPVTAGVLREAVRGSEVWESQLCPAGRAA